MNNYSLDADLAKKGSGGLGGMIKETGEYKGIIEWARELTFDSGAVAIEIMFKDINDQEAKVKLFVSSSGDKGASYGLKQLNALMTCVKVRKINGTIGNLDIWDFDEGKKMPIECIIFKELAGKAIGMLLQKEYYEYQGEMKSQVNLFAPFSLETNQTAKEILDQKGENVSIQKMAEKLEDKFRNNIKPSDTKPSSTEGATKTHSEPATPEDDDDDIPF